MLKPQRASWFETRGVAALLTMRSWTSSEEAAEAGVSKDEATTGPRGSRRAALPRSSP